MSTKIGHFEILSELSKSATCVVYKANDPQTSQTVALKAIQLSAFGERAAELHECLLAEAETAKVLSHSNLTPAHSAGEIDGQFCATMEYIQGNSIATMLARKEGFSIWDLLDIGRQVCSGLDNAHSQSVFHFSLEPAFNLGWKLASVLRKQSPPSLLHTYSAERRAIAKELIDFDREWATLLASTNDDGADPAKTQSYFVRSGRYTAGTATHYGPSILTGDGVHQHLAQGFVIGKRFHSAPVIRLADAKPVHLGHVVKADGRFRIFAFAGANNPTGPSSAIRRLCDFLVEGSDSPIRKYTPRGSDIDAVIDVRAVFQQAHRELAIEAMPALLLPRKGRYGLGDYEKLFCADIKSDNDIFAARGVDREAGCMVVVRPDQYVAHILPLDDYKQLASLFDGFMLPQTDRDARRMAEIAAA